MNKIVKRSENFADWYTSVIESANLVSYSNVKGCINYLPNGWAIWKNIENELSKEFKKINVLDVQLPPFIRMSDFSLEKEHIEGFAPEAFIITKKGDEILEDPYILRPTSEVLFSQVFKDILRSYKDLPLLYNQWCPAYRAEKTTKPFLRGSQFHWHEMHCLFSTRNEGLKFTKKILQVYKKFFENVCNLAVLAGEKTVGERFAGAENTFAIEVWSQDKQSIQAGTSHYLGTNFSEMYGLSFQNKDNKLEMPHYTSHGTSTRMIGGIIVSHGDDKGIVLPFLLAPTQISIITILGDKNPDVLAYAKKINSKLKKYRTNIDNSNHSLGYKINNSEINGTPFCIVIGPNDLKNNSFEIIKRNDGKKIKSSISDVSSTIANLIKQYSSELYNSSLKNLQSSIVEINTLDEFEKNINNHIVLAPWAGSVEDEQKIKQKYGVSPRVIYSNDNTRTCFFTSKKSKNLVYFARAY